MRGRVIAFVIIAACAATAFVLLFKPLWRTARPGPVTRPAPTTTTAATEPATSPASAPVILYDALDLLRADDPAYPTTQPLTFALELEDAARYVLRQPVRIDQRGDLWITDPRGQTLDDVIAKPGDERTHVVRQVVCYAHWLPTRRGAMTPLVITEEPGGGLTLRTREAAVPLDLPAGPRWDEARYWNGQIVVPTRRGVSVVSVDPAKPKAVPAVVSVNLFDPALPPDAPAAAPLVLFTYAGLLAYAPWDDTLPGGKIAQYAGGQWTPLLPADGWIERPLHLVPLDDGSVLQLDRDAEKRVRLTLRIAAGDGGPLSAERVAEITRLVTQLSARLPADRKAASEQLAQMGPAVWPTLDRLRPDQPPEGQARLEQILDTKLRPALGTLRPLEGPVKIVARLSDGGVVLLLEGGVEQADGTTAVPAWVSVRPGRVVERLSDFITDDFVPGRMKLAASGNDWLVHAPGVGMSRWVGNHLSPIAVKPFDGFDQILGLDASRRWLLTSSADPALTLVIDPLLPDPTPSLPVWPITAGEPAGWVKTPAGDLPAVKRGGVWVLDEERWRVLDKATEKFVTPATAAPVPPAAPATSPATGPATSLTTAESALLTLPDGTKYFGGQSDLRVRQPDGTEAVVPLPPEATGDTPAVLLSAGGRLFLYNYPGRLIRLTPAGVVDATFTHNIPSEPPERLWLDAAGRIIFLSGPDLAVCFPEGRLPPAIRKIRLDTQE